MKRALSGVLAASILATSAAAADSAAFKLGTFERAGKRFVGVVLKDSQVIDLAAADAALPGAKLVTPIADVKDAIARYDKDLRTRIQAIVTQARAASSRPGYLIDLSSVKTLPPIQYPT